MDLDKSSRAKLKSLVTKKLKELTETRIVIKTPFALSASEKKAFEKRFSGDIEYSIDQSLLGGFIIAQGSTVIDASLSNRLDNLITKHL